jgi:hypothetical protein
MKKSTKIILIIIVIVAAALIIINNFVRKDTDELLAKVNDNEIYLSDIESTAAMYGLQVTQEDAGLILEQLINNEVAQIYAQNTGMVNEPGFRNDFEWQKNKLKKELLINTMLEDITKSKTLISDDEVLEYVENNPYVKIRTIFIPVQGDTVKAEKEIYEAYGKLEKGADFERLQKNIQTRRIELQITKQNWSNWRCWVTFYPTTTAFQRSMPLHSQCSQLTAITS